MALNPVYLWDTHNLIPRTLASKYQTFFEDRNGIGDHIFLKGRVGFITVFCLKILSLNPIFSKKVHQCMLNNIALKLS